MSFDFPASVERDINLYAQAMRISPAEAATRLIPSALSSNSDKDGDLNPITDEELNQPKALDPSFGLLEDVPDEAIDRMATTIERMKQEGFARRD